MSKRAILTGAVCALAVSAGMASSAWALSGYTPVSSAFSGASTNVRLSNFYTFTCGTVVFSGSTQASADLETNPFSGAKFNSCKRGTEPVTPVTSGTWKLKETGLGTAELEIGGMTIEIPTLKCFITMPKQSVDTIWENGTGELDPSTLELPGAAVTVGGTCGETKMTLSGTFGIVNLTNPSEPIKQT